MEEINGVKPLTEFPLAVNITTDGRLVVAAYGDGTIRWHRMSGGVELLAFMPLADRTNWVAWTPEGFYAAAPAAHGILRWHANPSSRIGGFFRSAIVVDQRVSRKSRNRGRTPG